MVTNLLHPDTHKLHTLKTNRAPVSFHSASSGMATIHATMTYGLHCSRHNHIDFLKEEVANMMAKYQLTIILVSIAFALQNNGLLLTCVIQQQYWTPWLIVTFNVQV